MLIQELDRRRNPLKLIRPTGLVGRIGWPLGEAAGDQLCLFPPRILLSPLDSISTHVVLFGVEVERHVSKSGSLERRRLKRPGFRGGPLGGATGARFRGN